MKMALFLFMLTCGLAQAQTKPAVDNWKPLRYFVGIWVGSGKGDSGDSKVEREYKFALNSKFLQVTHRSTYDPKTANPKGNVHEDLGFFSYDRARKQFVFRQFHVEDFFMQFVASSISEDGKTVVLETENVENIPKTMRTRVTYKIVNENEFTETYEIAEPGKDYAVYWVKEFTRKKAG